MTGRHRLRIKQLERQAEGYLELAMPEHAIAALDRLGGDAPLGSHGLYLYGEALRAVERYDEALRFLGEASQLAPGCVEVWMAMGWCHKRVGRLDLAIEDLEQAREARPAEPLIHYNLACYLSLAGNKHRALAHLSEALAMNPDLRTLIDEESDFDPLRSDREFQALTNIIV